MFLSLGFTHTRLPLENLHAEANRGNVTEKLSLSREAPFLLAMIVRGSIIALAGGSQCEPCVDIILREGVICL